VVEVEAAATVQLRLLGVKDEMQQANHLHAWLVDEEQCPPLPVVKPNEQQHRNFGDAEQGLWL
jgi:hypothetical protein